ncbi:MAG TPA: NADH-quinone oxidoreductase subunit H [Solirubrobacter sp.]|nr:NADH-quinone oxidoreductase subunit H [Solirubrobacter sp.]
MIAVLAGILLAPLLPGTIQTGKAFAQGRRGTSPIQPYRTLKRLWGKSAVDPEGTGVVYRAAPAVAAAALLAALGTLATGGDALALVGLLALARGAVAAAAWDTGNGFALMGAARDLALAVFAEALLVLALLLIAQPAHSTDLDAMRAATAGWEIWSEPSHWCALLAFALVIVAETGRQPVDNPDTHLELTMIHEGPLLEYAGRDLAYLHWVAAARHWLILTLAALLYLPHADSVATLVVALPVLCVALAAVETAQAKMRILRVPALLGLGALIALAGAAAWPA